MMRWLAVGNTFLDPLWGDAVEIIRRPIEMLEEEIERHRDISCLYALNTGPWGNRDLLPRAAAIARKHGLPSVWVTCEDPNGFEGFIHEALPFDFVFTSDRVCIPMYRAYGKREAFWLPLAAQPRLHYPLPLQAQPADCVFIGNNYSYPARREALHNLLEPIVDAGYSLALYSYRNSSWPSRVARWWRGETSCYDCAQYYPAGRVALGMNCQADHTTMTSMRTFEALACGKPLLAYRSDAYAALGFQNGKHFRWVGFPQEALEALRQMLTDPSYAASLASAGRAYVLEHHTYERRAEYIRYVLNGGRDLLSFGAGNG